MPTRYTVLVQCAKSTSFLPASEKFDQCVDVLCSHSPSIYGDVNNDETVDLFDIFCVLEGFQGDFGTCRLPNVDIAPCTPDGIVDLFDLLGVLDAFGGVDACCAAAGTSPPGR